MTDGVIELYSPGIVQGLQQKNKRLSRVLLAISWGALAVCVALCFLTNTRNIYRMMGLCMAITVAAGWIVLYFYIFGIRKTKRTIAHAEHLQGQREKLTGDVTVDSVRIRIRGSIQVSKVRVRTETGERVCNINADCAEQLRRAGQRLTLYVVHGYVAAYEVCHEST